MAIFALSAVTTGCSSLPPGSGLPKVASSALERAPTTLTNAFESAIAANNGKSGVLLLTAGIDGLSARIDMIDAAQRSLDLQYYIFRADRSGGLIARALLRAADRGVRIRLLVDDGETLRGDEQILALAARPSIEVRIFNPLRYRGHLRILRGAEFLLGKGRLDYRMHDKLLVADNAAGLIGGRNIGDQYFQIDPASQFGDDDLLVVGPAIAQLSAVFDNFWNSDLAIPAGSVDARHSSDAALSRAIIAFARWPAQLPAPPAAPDGVSTQRLADVMNGRSPLLWAAVRVVYDSPDKKEAARARAARLIYRPVLDQVNAVHSELLMVTPYFIPTPEELTALESVTARSARAKVLTNSLAAAPTLSAQSGYMHFRPQLLRSGVELYEVRAMLGETRGSGQSRTISRYGNYALHAKLYVFDRHTSFLGSMNFDARSQHLNTEIGLLVDSAPLAAQIADRFAALTRPDNAYRVTLNPAGGGGMLWTTEEAGVPVRYTTEPARSAWQRLKVRVLTWLPLDAEL